MLLISNVASIQVEVLGMKFIQAGLLKPGFILSWAKEIFFKNLCKKSPYPCTQNLWRWDSSIRLLGSSLGDSSMQANKRTSYIPEQWFPKCALACSQNQYTLTESELLG